MFATQWLVRRVASNRPIVPIFPHLPSSLVGALVAHWVGTAATQFTGEPGVDAIATTVGVGWRVTCLYTRALGASNGAVVGLAGSCASQPGG